MQTLHTDDAVALHMRRWASGRPQTHGTVVIVHGLGEHIGRYGHVAAALNDAGWHVAGHDQRGHGASAGRRGVITHDDDLLRDLSRVIDQVRVDRNGPVVLLGHSLGGLVAGRFVAEGQDPDPADWFRPVDALVMSSPALDPGLRTWQKVMLALAYPLMPGLPTANGIKPEWISRDPKVVASYMADPLVHDRIAPRLARFIVDAADDVLDRATTWSLPTLLLYAGADRCVDPAGSDAFAADAPPSRVQTHRYETLYHEIFNEPEQADVLRTLSDWLAAPH